MRAELADKTQSAAFVKRCGLRTPETLYTLTDLEELHRVNLPERFALKYAYGWSARGVMLLQRTGREHFFCFLAQKHMTLNEVIKAQQKTASSFNREDVWLVEELVESTIDGKPIPFDYKFYCFRGRVGLVAQIDRNVYPPKVTLLNSSFAPLRPKVDYFLRSRNAQPGVPLVPLHAAALVGWARYLSLQTDSPFVSVDLYDSPEGPQFGEFTFSPGGTHRRMWVLSHEFLEYLDQNFDEGLFEMQAGVEDVVVRPASEECAPHVAPEVYRILAVAALDGSERAAKRLQKEVVGPTNSELDLAGAWGEVAEFLQRRRSQNYEDRVRFMKRVGINP